MVSMAAYLGCVCMCQLVSSCFMMPPNREAVVCRVALMTFVGSHFHPSHRLAEWACCALTVWEWAGAVHGLPLTPFDRRGPVNMGHFVAPG